MKEILIATRNEYKHQLFEYIFKDLGLTIKTLSNFNFTDEVEETGKNQMENALIKARFWYQKIGLPTFGDDAGVEIEALGGEPGLEVRRWQGKFNDNVDDEVWLAYLLERMKDVPLADRMARGRSAWVLILPTGQELTKEVTYEFLILEKPIRPYKPGSPLSAVRFDLKYNKPELELTKQEYWQPFLEEMKSWKEFRDIFCD